MLKNNPWQSDAFHPVVDPTRSSGIAPIPIPDWDPERPLYCLPESAIEQLESPLLMKEPILKPNALEAEMAFTQSCRRKLAIGVLGGLPITFQPLSPPLPNFSPHLLKAYGLSTSDIYESIQIQEETKQLQEDLRRIVGFLITDPTFDEECRLLRSHWDRLSPSCRPKFPLARAGWLTGGEEEAFPDGQLIPVGLDSELEDFLDMLKEFLNRWELAGMATWELPIPQGPHSPCTMPPDAIARPNFCPEIRIPTAFHVSLDGPIVRQIPHVQRQSAIDRGLPTDFASLTHHSFFAGMLDVDHLERSIRQRIPNGEQPLGFVISFEQVAATCLKCSVDLIQKTRKAISACRRGLRSTVRDLQNRS